MYPETLTFYDIAVAPAVRDADVLIPMFFFWFAVQHLSHRALLFVSGAYRNLNVEQQRNLVIRCVSIINGIISINTALAFVRGGMKGGAALYEPIDGYRPFRASIVSYFMWDVVVCYAFNWTPAWKFHGWASLAGTYLLAFPFADTYGTYFTGMFELSNGFLHTAEIFNALDETRPPAHRKFGPIVSAAKYTFALLFFLIRILGGSYVTFHWFHEARALIASGQYHSLGAVLGVCLVIVVIMALQYYWFYVILVTVFGSGANPADAAQNEEEKRPTAASVKLRPDSSAAVPRARESTKRRAPARKDE